MSPRSLSVYLLGLVEFDAVLALQQRLTGLVLESRGRKGALILCEHPPHITVGREGSVSHIRVDAAELESRQIRVQHVNRGGGCLIHAPGQLAVYPVVPLFGEGWTLGLDAYGRSLEQIVIDACRDVPVPAWRTQGRPGVFSRLGCLAHVGVAVRDQVAYHGIFVNVHPSAELLKLVQPRVGDPTERATTLSSERNRSVSMQAVRESMLRHLTAQLGYEQVHVQTGHPLLKRTKRMVYVGA